MNDTLTDYIAFGPNVWGKAKTEPEAIANMVEAGGSKKVFDLYKCHPDTTVGGLGDFSYPSGTVAGEFAPVILKRVRGGKEIPVN